MPVPLHVHSSFSPLWGVRTPEEIVDQALSLGYRHLAITDRNGLYGLFVFLDCAREKGIVPIIGAEVEKSGQRALCWVRDATGYQHLCRILSERHCDPDFSVSDALLRYRSGIIVASDSPRVLGQLGRQKREDLYVEVSPGHFIACHIPVEELEKVGPVIVQTTDKKKPAAE